MALVLLVVAMTVVFGNASPAQAATSWGTAGAQYDGGVLCTLDATTRVPMARWLVAGREAFATADVSGSPLGDGPAPVGGTPTPLVAGQDGLDERGAAVLAYLIEHHGSGSSTETAEVSALVAAASGGGGLQARCLGQQGTSSTDSASLLAEAQRYAGPYRLTVATPQTPAPPGTAAAVTVTVVSATGVPVPGIDVAVAGVGATLTAGTDAQGVAAVNVVTPMVASTPITATVQEPTGLLFAADTVPTAVAVGAASPVSATGTLAADLHPHPALHVDVGGGLEPVDATIPVTARVSGTYGFAGTGTVTLAGPAAPGADGRCSTLPASAYAAAPNAWSQPFTFDGDGARPVGTSPRLAAGCYVAGGSVTVTGVTPVATAGAPFETGAVIDVIPLTVRRSAAPVLALPGRLATAVSVDGGDDATVSSAATVYGPVTPSGGRCDTVTFAGAAVAGTADPVAHQPASGDARTVVLRSPALTRLGCYAVRVSTMVGFDGRTLTVGPDVGTPGTVSLLVRPTLTLADDRYDTTRGSPMIGRVTVAGTYRFPGVVTVRLRSAAPRFDGCRSLAFPSVAGGPTATAATTGDGSFTFATPVPQANACYAVEATLQMADAPAVHVAGPSPSAATVFLAGQPSAGPTGPDVVHRPASMLRAQVGLLGSVLLMLVVAGSVIGRVTMRRRGTARAGGPDADFLF